MNSCTANGVSGCGAHGVNSCTVHGVTSSSAHGANIIVVLSLFCLRKHLTPKYFHRNIWTYFILPEFNLSRLHILNVLAGPCDKMSHFGQIKGIGLTRILRSIKYSE